VTRVAVRRVEPDEWQTFRDIRLAALADAPSAYLTTLAEAQAQPDQLWRDRQRRIGVRLHLRVHVGRYQLEHMVH